MAGRWYDARKKGDIKSNNFQLHPPRGKNNNIFRNTFGNLEYPLMFSATFEKNSYSVTKYDPKILKTGLCEDIGV